MIPTAFSSRGAGSFLAVVVVSSAVYGQSSAPSVVDYTPETPPTATYPVFTDVAPTVGAGGTEFDDPGTGRGMCIVDLVGPDPLDPTNPAKVGGPDGILDIFQANSNSPALPLGAAPGTEEVLGIGTLWRPSLLLRGDASGTYTDVAAAASALQPEGWGVNYPGGSPWAVIAVDIEGDGDQDLVVGNGGFNIDSRNALLRNNGDGQLENITLAAGMPEVQPTFAVSALDYDRDGDVDLYIGNSGLSFGDFWTGSSSPDSTDRLFENDGTGNFVDVGAAAECDLKSNSFMTATGDLDLNGYTDIVVSCYEQYNKVFYNDGDGTFSFMSPETNPAFGMSLSDLVQDGHNPNTWVFPSVPDNSEKFFPLLGFRTMPVEIADFNGDRWPDVLFLSWTSQQADADPDSAEGGFFSPVDRAKLYLNRGDQDGDGVGDGIFREATAALGLDHIGGSMGLAVGDYNGDGALDVYVGAGGPKLADHAEEDYLYINEPTSWPADFLQAPTQSLGQAFWEVGALAGTYSNKFMAHGANMFLRNGRVDAVVGNGGPAPFDAGQRNVWYRNGGNADGLPYTTTRVRLNADRSAPGAPGARVEVVTDGPGGPFQTLSRQISMGARFGSHNTDGAYFGLGQGGALHATVHWPSGVTQGRVLWLLDQQPTELVFDETETSMALAGTYPPGGGLELNVRFEELGAQPRGLSLVFVHLADVGSGVFLPSALIPVGTIVLQPDTPVDIQGLITAPATGLYGLVAVDLLTGEIANSGAYWHEPALGGGTVAATWTPPTVGTEAAPEPTFRSRRAADRIRVRATAVEISPARMPARFERFELVGKGERELPSGDRLRWADGVVELLPQGFAQVDRGGPDDEVPGAVHVTTDVTIACCDARVESGPRFYLRFPADAELLDVDGIQP